MLFPCTDQQFRELHIDLFLKSGWIICEQIHEKGSGHTEPSSSPISSPLYELKELGTSISMHYSCAVVKQLLPPHTTHLKTLNYIEETQAKTYSRGWYTWKEIDT